MLARLFIKNYILIHELEIEFGEGFSVVTGETGSGKSILLGALGMILGQRADADVLLDKSGKCIVEGVFNIRGYGLEPIFSGHDLDFEEVLLIRREINNQGKSRAFINDTPVNLTFLKELGERLVNIHSQNSIVTLNDSNFQLAVLDSYAGLMEKVGKYRKRFNQYLDLQRKLTTLIQQETAAAGERDYNTYLLNELVSANLVENELPELEEKLNILRHAEEIKSNLYQVANILNGDETNILNLISDGIKNLENVGKYNQKFREYIDRLQVNYVDLKDLSEEISGFKEGVEIDPEEISRLSRRQDQLYRLLNKHQLQTVEELFILKQSLDDKINGIANLKEDIEKLKLEVNRVETELIAQAHEVSVTRQTAVPKFEKDIIAILSRLGIPHARFQIEFQSSESITRDGIDKIRFTFSANKGIGMKDIAQSASGGELSRLMLGVKSMISERNLLPTIIFDEIDNGVSGDIAGKVGLILQTMGRHMQVIAITHLPQIAGQGNHHFRVFKSEEGHISKTYISKLSGEERIEEIAKMLSNELVTNAARQAAKELIIN